MTSGPGTLDRRIDALILDLDGVLYRGDEALPGARALLPTLQSAGVSVILATNNATLSAAEVRDKLARMGIVVAERSILTSAQATAAWLGAQAPDGARVYAIGTPSLRAVLLALPGFRWDEAWPDF